MVRFDYGNGPHQASKGRIVLYIAGDIFTLFLSELIFWPIELYAKGRTERVATAYFDQTNHLRMWTVARPGGEILIREGQLPTPAPEVMPGVEGESPSADGAATRTGTGFFVDGNGTVLTSQHVVSGATRIAAICGGEPAAEASVLGSSESTDLAILHTGLKPAVHLTLARPRSASVGQRVFTYGYPVADVLGAEPKFTEGTISALSGPGGEQTFLQISVPVQPGNSGGPVVNEAGEVVGIVVAAAAIEPFLEKTGTLPQKLNWAVKAEYGSVLFEEPEPMQPRRTARMRSSASKEVFASSRSGDAEVSVVSGVERHQVGPTIAIHVADFERLVVPKLARRRIRASRAMLGGRAANRPWHSSRSDRPTTRQCPDADGRVGHPRSTRHWKQLNFERMWT